MIRSTSLQALENLNRYVSYQYGSSFVGKKVSIAMYGSTSKYVPDMGVVTQADYSSGNTAVIVNDRPYGVANIMEMPNGANYGSYQYATSLVGKEVQAIGYDVNGNVVENMGIVSSCTFAFGEVMVVVDGQEHTLSTVRQVLSQNTDPKPTDPETSDDMTVSDTDSSGPTDPDTRG